MSRWQQIDFRYSTNVEMGYSAVPFVRSIIGEVITILFSNRDNMGKSFLQEVKLRIKTDDSIEVIEDKGVVLLEAGNEGAFDSAGTMACQLARIQNKNYLYYIGWNIGNDVPFRNSIGVAEENEDGSFKKLFDGPIVDRSIYDPCFVASMNVIPFKNRYLMYYLSCVEWVKTDGGDRKSVV